jgi:ubiquinone/menaquinone biosynthesis C-methylase UbiE
MSVEEKDHFSGHAACYQQFRPNYPAPLFEYLASLCHAHDLAWDCATGNGQAAVALAPYFANIIATDFSAQQIDQAHADPRVRYLVAPADEVPIQDAQVDLVTVAQALHWFDLATFYPEVRRVVRPDGIVAVWCYELHHITPEIDAIVHRLYADIVGAYWPPERRIVEDGYRTLAFPFEELATPEFQMVHSWNLEHLMGYFGSWSSTQRYRKQTGDDPIALIADGLKAAWGDPERTRDVVWPLNLRVGRVFPDGTVTNPKA